MKIGTKELLKIMCSCGLQIFLISAVFASIYYCYNIISDNWLHIAMDVKNGFELIKPVFLKVYEYNWSIFFGWLAITFWTMCTASKIDEKYKDTALRINIFVLFLFIIGFLLLIINTIILVNLNNGLGFLKGLGIFMVIGVNMIIIIAQYYLLGEIRNNVPKTEGNNQLDFFDILDEEKK